MRFLIDTHVCLWAVAEKHKLSGRSREALEDLKNEIYFSQVSLLEIAIKFQTGKLANFNVSLPVFNDALLKMGFILLPIKNDHLYTYFSTNLFSENHRDPFDRYLLATAAYEHCGIITKDEKFQFYNNSVEIVW